MTSDQNPFGGKNPHGMYVPMSDDELETLARLAESGSFKLVIKDWGYITGFTLDRFVAEAWKGNPLVTFGDKIVHFYWVMNFSAPEVPQPNWYFDVEVWALDRLMFKQRMPTEVNGKPVQIVKGQMMAMVLDVAIDKINPELIRMVKPQVRGLTSRQGNMQLTPKTRKLLAELKQGERFVRDLGDQEARDATEKMKKGTR